MSCKFNCISAVCKHALTQSLPALLFELCLYHNKRSGNYCIYTKHYQPCRINPVTKYRIWWFWCVRSVSPTLDGPLEEGLAGLTGRHTIVVSRGDVATYQAQPLGHSSQHELTLHWAFFFPKPSPLRHRGENLFQLLICRWLEFLVGRTNQPGCSEAASQPRRVAVGALRVQAIAVVVAFDQGPVAGVCVWRRASGAGLGWAGVTLRAGAWAGGFTLYGGRTGGV